MKPVTAQDYAKCYGTFIANLKSAGYLSWFAANFSEISTMEKLNPSIFLAYSATIPPWPRIEKLDKGGKGGKNIKTVNRSIDNYNRVVDIIWTTLAMNLNFGMTQAEVEPSRAKSKLVSFGKQKPIKRPHVNDY